MVSPRFVDLGILPHQDAQFFDVETTGQEPWYDKGGD